MVLLTDTEDFAAISDLGFISAKQMLAICLFIEIIVQSFALVVQPTSWWTWQLLGFIAATNLGAVILAIFAQRSADKISAVYKRIFTTDFYQTVKMVSDFRAIVISEAEKDGNTLEDELDIIGPEIYTTMKLYLKTKQEHEQIETPEVEVPYISSEEATFLNDDELFVDDA